jgi:hypothetical protein
MWQTIGFIIGGAAIFDPGCMMTSRIDTVPKPGTRAGVRASP